MRHSAQPIPRATVLAIHKDQISRHGGADGIRDNGLLDSALKQPFASFDGKDLYPAIEEKAARYGYGIIKNHPFVDGNKRTGAAVIIVFLRANGIKFKPRAADFYTVIIDVVEGSATYEDLVSWIKEQAG